jgi:hypothetical protein
MLIDLQRRGLKVIVGLAVKLAGGQENAVNVTSRIQRHATFSDYGNTRLPDRHVPIDVAVEIDQFNGKPLVVKAMAQLLGFWLTPIPSVAVTGSSMGALCCVAKEAGEAIAAISEFVDAGGTMEADRKKKVVREVDDAIEALLAVRARLLPAGSPEEME